MVPTDFIVLPQGLQFDDNRDPASLGAVGQIGVRSYCCPPLRVVPTLAGANSVRAMFGILPHHTAALPDPRLTLSQRFPRQSLHPGAGVIGLPHPQGPPFFPCMVSLLFRVWIFA